jgi:ATP-binding cassette subfamily B protein
MRDFLNLLSTIKNYKKRYIVGILCIILVDITQLILPLILSRITDLFQSDYLNKSNLLFNCILVFLTGVSIFVFRFFWRYLVQGAARKLEMDIRNKFYEHLTKQSRNFFHKYATGDLMAHVTNDINNIFMALGQGVVFLFDSTFIPIFAIAMLIVIGGFKFAFITLIPLIILTFIVAFVSNSMQSRIQKIQESFSDLTEFSRETISGIRVLKGFVQEKKQFERFSYENKRNRDRNIKYLTITSMLFPIIMSVSAISFAIIIWYGGSLVISGEITLGDFVAYNSYIGLLSWPFAAFGWMINIFQRGIVSKKRIDKIMEVYPEITDTKSDKSIKKLVGDIEFKNVSFTYPKTDIEVLKDINFKIKKGNSLGIIGKTGSGKTTIANLLMRFYEVKKGDILIDNNDIKSIPFNILYKNTTLVPQDSFLFSETISENIKFFREFKEDEVENATKFSKVYNDIVDFPEAFETFVGEKGITLSGGQKQRISISRSLIGDSDIILFDDCLSAVDAKTEEEILTEFEKSLKGKTRIIISNRISAIKNVDEIIVLKDGKIHERGKHEDLIKSEGFYSELYKIQILEKKILN